MESKSTDAWWLRRLLQPRIEEKLRHEASVAILGPRQVGKTTLALDVAGDEGLYLDLESPVDRAKLDDPVAFLKGHTGRLVILDEVQQMPGLFGALRGLIDQQRRRGAAHGMFLLLGSASADLLRQSESLAGRISYLELFPLNLLELPAEKQDELWVRGGFPRSFLAADQRVSLAWREDFIRTYLERDIPQLGMRIPATSLLRFWTMLAHVQGGILNAAHLARSLDVDGKTIARYLDLMCDLLLVRRLPPFHANVGKRLIKSPKVYIRDSGLVHALLRIPDRDTLLGHPVTGGSWEGFAIETLLAVAPAGTHAFYYRTSNGAEIDLVLDLPGHGRWAIEIKRGLAAKPEKGFHIGCGDIEPARRFLVNAGDESYVIGQGVEVIGLRLLASLVAELAGLLPRTQQMPRRR